MALGLGGKTYLARRIVSLMPGHLHYVEPFAGGLAVLLAKDPEGHSEAVNDYHGGLTNFWRVLQEEASFQRFERLALATPFSQSEWERSQSASVLQSPDPVVRAWGFFVQCRQSLAGRMDSFAPLSRRRVRRGMNEQASAWLGAVDGLRTVHERLRRVVILGPADALDILTSQDGPQTLFYLDPPYLPETRTAPDVYEFEQPRAWHERLLTTLLQVQGHVMLSGYASALYDEILAGWSRHVFGVPNHAAGGAHKARRQEVLWCNFASSRETTA